MGKTIIIAVGALLLTTVIAGCGEDAACEDLRQELLNLVKESCPPATSNCGGNPSLTTPRVPYSQLMHKLQEQLKTDGCDPADLGQSPVFCNMGEPQCFDGYTCCKGACAKQCP